jgi:hypothetical protein
MKKTPPKTKFMFFASFYGPVDDRGNGEEFTYKGLLPVANKPGLKEFITRFQRLLLEGEPLPKRKPPRGMVRVSKKAASSEENE